MTTHSISPAIKSRGLPRVAGFYAITFALAILVRLLIPWVGHAALPLTMMTPAISTAIMLGLVAREAGPRETLRSLGLTRLGIKGWPLAIFAPMAIMSAGLIALWASGLTGIASVHPGPALVLDLVVSLIVSSLFALGEEVGWRGYMLPRLLQIGPIAAMLVTGFLQSLWHLPIMMTTDLYHPGANLWIAVPLFVITITLAGVFFGALRMKTGSVWPAAIAHGAVNIGWELSFQLTETRTPLTTEYLGGESGLFMIAGLAVMAILVARHANWLRPKD
jgi:uncharacterized protein